jgi:serine/threonine-protein kinase
VAAKIANDPPEPFATSLRYAPELDALLQRGMAKAPEERLPSCEDLGNQLTELLMLRTTLTGPEGGRVFEASTLPSRTSHAPRMKSVPPPRSSLRWFAVGVVALIGLGLLVRSALRHRPSPEGTLVTTSASETSPAPPPPAPSSVRPRRPPAPKPQPTPSPRSVDEPRPPSTADAPPPP